jgi:hypothetical protein
MLSQQNIVGVRCKRWLQSFQPYLMSKGYMEPARKQALLLRIARKQPQDVYFAYEDKQALSPAKKPPAASSATGGTTVTGVV